MSNKLYIGNVEIKLKTSLFPGGEVYVKIEDKEDNRFNKFKIMSHIKNSNDVMELLMLTDAVRREYGSDVSIDLVMPYIPYARQDRVCREGESLSIKVFCDLINSQKYSSVLVWDPHSDVATALLHNVVVIEQWVFIKELYTLLEDAVLVSPDAGAVKKVNLALQTTPFKSAYYAEKVRHPDTGNIIDTVVNNTTHIGSKDFVIIDDICDGGRTFVELSKKLKDLTDGKIFLYTTHGIYSKGLRPMLPYIDHFYTANPFADMVSEDLVTVIKF